MVIGPGVVGSYTDVATLLVVLVQFGYVIRPRQADLAAGVVALATGREDVDDDRLAADLDVDEQQVAQYRTDGGG